MNEEHEKGKMTTWLDRLPMLLAPTTYDTGTANILCLIDILQSLYLLYAAVGAELEAREGRCRVTDGLLYIFTCPALASMQDCSIGLLEASSLIS